MKKVCTSPRSLNCRDVTTDATSIDELTVEIREAIQLYPEAEGMEPSNLEFVGIQRVTIAA